MVNSISLVFIFVEGDISLPTLALLNSPKWKIKCQKITTLLHKEILVRVVLQYILNVKQLVVGGGSCEFII